MSVDAIGRVSQAISGILEAQLAGTGVATEVFIGSPSQRGNGAAQLISLFMFHMEPNKEMRNFPRAVNGLPDPVAQDALPVDLRYMISFFRTGAGSETDELIRLGHVIAALHANSTIGEAMVPGQNVRLTPEPYPMEEISRVWGLFNDRRYVTSVVYLASPVFIDARAALRGAPVESRRLDSGHNMETPDVFGRGEAGT
jgi:hypothetical protein